MQHSGNGAIDNWDIVSSTNSGGTGNELRSTFQQVNPGTSRIVSPMINTIGMAKLSLGFRSTLDDWAPGATLRIQSSTDGVSWTNEAWSLSTSSNTMVGPVTINTTLSHNLNSEHTFLAFVVEGNLYKYDFWYIDDVSVKCATALPVQITASGNPPEGGSVTGSGTYLFGETVTVSAFPSQGWQFLNWTENGEVVSNFAFFMLQASTRNLIANFSSTEANVVLSSSPSTGGMTLGSGIYLLGSMVSIQALPNEGYEFAGWTCNGELISLSSAYSFHINTSIHLEAQFKPLLLQPFAVAIEASPSQGGVVYGGGTYLAGKTASIYANPYAGWVFEAWIENDSIMSYRPVFSFPVVKEHHLSAVFRQELSVQTEAFPPGSGITSGGGSCFTGDTVTCKATKNEGWEFSKWTLNGLEVSRDSVYSFSANADCLLKAVFVSGVGEVEIQPAEVSIYPNPSKGWIHIASPVDEPYKEIRIYDISGKIVLHKSLLVYQNESQMDLTGLLPGSYLVSLLTRSGKEKHYKLLIGSAFENN